jgi:hypothetical protein
MKYLLPFVLLSMVGCSSMPSPVEIVYVDKPILTSPKPPTLPAFNSQVDKLTSADAKTPGVVGVAYKADMITLRAIENICRQTFAEYETLPQPTDVAGKLQQSTVKQ